MFRRQPDGRRPELMQSDGTRTVTLPESGHGWTIYEYTSETVVFRFGRSVPGWTTRRPIAWSVVGGRWTKACTDPPRNANRQASFRAARHLLRARRAMVEGRRSAYQCVPQVATAELTAAHTIAPAMATV